MADIDKVLPNISEQPEQTTDELAVEMSEQLQEQAQPGEVEIINTEDGGVEVDFDPNQMDPGDASDFNANLAEFLDSQQLTVIGSGLYSNYVDYKTSRKDWEKAYTSGLDLLGFKYEDRSEPFSVLRVPLIRCLLKLLLSFRRWHIKSYSQLMDQSEHK